VGILCFDRIVVRDGLTELKEFFKIGRRAPFGVFSPEGGITALTGQAGDLVFVFYFLRQREKSLGAGVHCLDNPCRDPMVFHRYKSNLFISVSEGGNKGSLLLRRAGEFGKI